MTPDLIKKVEGLDGPDRAVDLLIAQALVPDVVVLRQRDDDTGADPYTHWEYTASLDAVVALIERVLPGRGHGYLPGFVTGKPYGGVIAAEGERSVDLLKATIAGGDTPALAMLLALLRSLEARDKGDG